MNITGGMDIMFIPGSLFLILIVLLSPLCAAETHHLSPLWHPFPGERALGGCDRDLTQLEAAYSEAITMAKGAISALEVIRDPKPHKDKDSLSLSPSEIKELYDWIRIRRAAFSLLRIEAPEDGVKGGDDLNRLDFAQGK